MKYQRCQNRDFSYPDRILVGIRDFQAKQGESWRDRDGWTVWSLDIYLYRSFATLKCEHNVIFLSNGLIFVATCVIGCFDVFYALWLAEKIRPRFSTNQKKIKLLRTNRISFLAVFPPLRNWFHNNITSRHFATWIGSGRLQRKWQYLYFPAHDRPSHSWMMYRLRLLCHGCRVTKFEELTFLENEWNKPLDIEKVQFEKSQPIGNLFASW